MYVLLAGLAVASVALAIWGIRLGRQAAAGAAHLHDAVREAEGLRLILDRLSAERDSFAAFLKDVPHLGQSLRSAGAERQLPAAIIEIVRRTFEPREALVLVRRKGHPHTQRLVVAAAEPRELSGAIGTEIELGEGELGYVASHQEVLTRTELSTLAGVTQYEPPQKLAGFRSEVAAPIVWADETLGLIAVGRHQRNSGVAGAVLRVIADMSASALSDAVARQRMATVAQIDELTQLYNRRHILRLLSEEIHRAQRLERGVSVFLFDVDHFKHYNDLNGHMAGDILLRLLASLLKENMRATDSLGRFGGEEFLLVLPATPADQALAVAEKLRALVAEHAFPAAAEQPLGRLSLSGGVAHFPTHAQVTPNLLRAADQALYTAKHRGRDRVVMAKAGQGDLHEPALSFEDEL